MEEPLFTDVSLDFGPSAFATEPTPLQRVHGKKPAQLRSEIRRFCPRKPGVYGMVDGNGDLIYIGKAKNLRSRLLSYFRRQRERRAGRIIRQAGGIVEKLVEMITDQVARLRAMGIPEMGKS